MNLAVFYLLFALFQVEGARLEGFGVYAECMEKRAEWEAEGSILAINRCDEIKVYPVSGEVDHGTK